MLWEHEIAGSSPASPTIAQTPADLDSVHEPLAVRRGLNEGIAAADLLHAITIAIPTAGFPATAAAYQWAREVLDSSIEQPE